MWVYGGRSEAETRSRGLSRGASFIEHGVERNTASRLRRDVRQRKPKGAPRVLAPLSQPWRYFKLLILVVIEQSLNRTSNAHLLGNTTASSFTPCLCMSCSALFPIPLSHLGTLGYFFLPYATNNLVTPRCLVPTVGRSVRSLETS